MIEKRGGKNAPIVEGVADKSPMIILSSDCEEDENEDDKDDDARMFFGNNMNSDLNDLDMEEDGEGSYHNNEVADEVEEDPLRHHQFDIKITDAMAYSKQVM
ncbi:hypothetical protein A2U01_0055902, partial [Trifolium medium]|nr:hypothetical protein [Trifolium medium]